MTFLVAADLHSRPELYRQLASACKRHKPEALILAGDAINKSWEKGLLTAAEVANVLNGVAAQSLILVQGNHDGPDLPELEAALTRPLVKLAGHGWNVDGVVVVGWPCTLEDDFNFLLGLEQPGEDWLRETLLSNGPGARRLWICHERPFGSALAGQEGTAMQGSRDLHEAIENYHPHVVICGHVHKPMLQKVRIGETRVYNTGQPDSRLRYVKVTCDASGPISAEIQTAP